MLIEPTSMPRNMRGPPLPRRTSFRIIRGSHFNARAEKGAFPCRALPDERRMPSPCTAPIGYHRIRSDIAPRDVDLWRRRDIIVICLASASRKCSSSCRGPDRFRAEAAYDLARSIGKGIAEFKKASDEVRKGIEGRCRRKRRNSPEQAARPTPVEAARSKCMPTIPPVRAPPGTCLPRCDSLRCAFRRRRTAGAPRAGLNEPGLESSPEEVRQPVTEHLVELTRPVIRSLIAFGAGTAACSTSQGEIYKRLIRPVTDALPADSS